MSPLELSKAGVVIENLRTAGHTSFRVSLYDPLQATPPSQCQQPLQSVTM